MKHFKSSSFRFTLLFLFWQVFTPLHAQENLILNPSIENTNDIELFNNFSFFHLCQNWFNPSDYSNTVDLFSKITESVPNNLRGYQYSEDGNN